MNVREATPDQKILRVFYIASEAEPLIKVGGLGDVAGSLPKALAGLDPSLVDGYKLDVRMAIPYHSEIRDKLIKTTFIDKFPVKRKDDVIIGEVFKSDIDEALIYLIGGEPIPFDGPVYNRDAHLDSEKYIFFSIASLALVQHLEWIPHIIIANDWHTGVALHAFKQMRETQPEFSDTRSILIIHNLPYMGSDSQMILDKYGLAPPEDDNLPEWARRFPLPLGIYAADHIVTVSPTYAQEIMTPQFGCGLDEYLKTKSEQVSGILNGLDVEEWDPFTDKVLKKRFNINTLSKRKDNKIHLLDTLDMDVDINLPLLIIISRMDHQKGIDIAVDALRIIIDKPWNAIILGTGTPEIETLCRSLEGDYPDRVRTMIRYDSKLARQMYAGADMILLPSRYEPCGLAQMIAMRYGCVPVVHATGGLSDTVHESFNPKNNNGFIFQKLTIGKMAKSICRGLDIFKESSTWRTIQENGMKQDFSWTSSAIPYTDLFFNLRGKK